ncbi:hypothetical protein [Pseudaminobacter sp. NGMCC 1.201702]|uniref:hypothetical protein n=1 Tax=Pseudaminobacter sp. NGMCC 1.201702 TaxID=3391825 RepID=UPI0039EE8CE0
MAYDAATRRNHGPLIGTDAALPPVRNGHLKDYLSAVPGQPWLWLVAIVALNLLLVAAMVVLDRHYGIDYWNLVRDTNAIAGQPAYFGFYSNLGILLWAVAACSALFGWLSLRRLGVADLGLRPLMLGGLFAAIACLDDLFMLHENAYLVGIPEKAAMAFYALFLFAFAASTLPVLHRTKWILLGASLGSLAISTLVDLMDLQIAGSVLIEEAFKLSGIAFLASYLITLSFSALADHCAALRA